MTRPLSARRARAASMTARLVKSPDWSESRRWHVVADGRLLVVIEPSYGGTSRTGRNGWNWWLADGARSRHKPQLTRGQAAIIGLAAWQRWATWKEK